MITTLAHNSATNLALTVVKIAIAFVMAPVVVRALGNHDYGVWEILGAIIGYMGILDIGIQPSIVRYVARYKALSLDDQLRKTYASALLFMGLLGFLVFSILITWAFVAPDILSDGNSHLSKYSLFLIILAGQMVVTFPGYVFDSFHAGYQRYSLKNAINIVSSLVGCTIIYVLLLRGGGLLTFALGNAIITWINSSTYWLLLRHPRYGGFRLRKQFICWRTLKELLGFGSQIMALGVAERITATMDTMLIGLFLGPIMVTFYVIPANLLKYAHGFISSVTLGFMPMFSELDARGDKAVATEMFLTASRYVLGFALLFLTGILFMGAPFISVWMGPEYAQSGTLILAILTFAYLIKLSIPFAGRFLTGIGHQSVLVRYGWQGAVIGLIALLVLINPLGIQGVALAALISALVIQPFVLREVCKHLGITMYKYLSNSVFPLAIPVSLLAVFLFGLTRLFQVISYGTILAIAFTGLVIYVASYVIFATRQSERQIFLCNVKHAAVLTGVYNWLSPYVISDKR